ncbi:MAG: hypothetical protein ACQESG_06145 [Nanobdellota archaeon]
MRPDFEGAYYNFVNKLPVGFLGETCSSAALGGLIFAGARSCVNAYRNQATPLWRHCAENYSNPSNYIVGGVGGVLLELSQYTPQKMDSLEEAVGFGIIGGLVGGIVGLGTAKKEKMLRTTYTCAVAFAGYSALMQML